jgi:hypothetical protein
MSDETLMRLLKELRESRRTVSWQQDRILELEREVDEDRAKIELLENARATAAEALRV